MMRWLQAILPKEERFFVLFAEHAAAVVAGAEALRAAFSGGTDLSQNLKTVMDCEHEGDRITREVLLALRRSFITPFDRGDIARLIQSMDDASDQMQKTAKTILLFNVTRFEPEMVQMADCIVRASGLMKQAIPLLNAINKNVDRLNSLTEQIVRVESEADDLYDAARKRLFEERADTHPMEFWVAMQILEHLEKVTDSLDDVANEVHSIVTEHV
jgi:predicted phosphate transport protein (TIGR00153 family)